jgi:glutamate 5-kinase
VSVEEIKIGDNDTLAARSAILWNAGLLILLSDIDGLFDKNPKTHSDAALVPEVDGTEALNSLSGIDTAGSSSLGTGGIVTKIEAARLAMDYGIPVLLAHGGRPRALEALAQGRQQGTVFHT